MNSDVYRWVQGVDTNNIFCCWISHHRFCFPLSCDPPALCLQLPPQRGGGRDGPSCGAPSLLGGGVCNLDKNIDFRPCTHTVSDDGCVRRARNSKSYISIGTGSVCKSESVNITICHGGNSCGSITEQYSQAIGETRKRERQGL